MNENNWKKNLDSLAFIFIKQTLKNDTEIPSLFVNFVTKN